MSQHTGAFKFDPITNNPALRQALQDERGLGFSVALACQAEDLGIIAFDYGGEPWPYPKLQKWYRGGGRQAAPEDVPF